MLSLVNPTLLLGVGWDFQAKLLTGLSDEATVQPPYLELALSKHWRSLLPSTTPAMPLQPAKVPWLMIWDALMPIAPEISVARVDLAEKYEMLRP